MGKNQFTLLGLLIGVATGLGVYAIIRIWGDRPGEEALPMAAVILLATTATAFLLLMERDSLLRAAPAALGIGAALSIPSYFALQAEASTALSQFPVIFWFFPSAPLAGYLMTTLVKASLADGAPPRYATLFFHGLTLPLIYAGAGLFTVLSIVLLYAWAALLRSMEVDFFHRLFQEPWFIMPFAGAIGGLSIAMMRGFDAALGGLRFVALLFCRIAMPITAVLSLTFVAVLIAKGTDVVFALATPGAIMLALAYAGVLIFNGVYQSGENGPPALWLRIATVVTLATFPIYAGLAFWSLLIRVGEYGLTPARVIGLAMNGLAALYIVVCAAGLLTELRLGAKRWMPLVGPLNALMAAIWIAVLVVLATPLINPWALSAKDQEQRLLSGRVPAAEFDFAYLKFQLGKPGEKALGRLAETPASHPEAQEIRAKAAEALAATSPVFMEPVAVPTAPAAPTPPEDDSLPGLDDLPLNPGDEGDTDAPEQEPPS